MLKYVTEKIVFKIYMLYIGTMFTMFTGTCTVMWICYTRRMDVILCMAHVTAYLSDIAELDCKPSKVNMI